MEQLKRVKALDDYHPRLRQTADAQKLSIRDFNAHYEGINETKSDVVSVFGMHIWYHRPT